MIIIQKKIKKNNQRKDLASRLKIDINVNAIFVIKNQNSKLNYFNKSNKSKIQDDDFQTTDQETINRKR